ncbi:hypothetical protein E4U37_004548 [Claviceps purpurea]|nr:hypothetical protein E4U37_004548 [Claviceps purpurea]
MVNIGKSRYCIHTSQTESHHQTTDIAARRSNSCPDKTSFCLVRYICCSKQIVADGRGLMAGIGNSAGEDEPNETPRHSYDAAQGYGASV